MLDSARNRTFLSSYRLDLKATHNTYNTSLPLYCCRVKARGKRGLDFLLQQIIFVRRGAFILTWPFSQPTPVFPFFFTCSSNYSYTPHSLFFLLPFALFFFLFSFSLGLPLTLCFQLAYPFPPPGYCKFVFYNALREVTCLDFHHLGSTIDHHISKHSTFIR